MEKGRRESAVLDLILFRRKDLIKLVDVKKDALEFFLLRKSKTECSQVDFNQLRAIISKTAIEGEANEKRNSIGMRSPKEGNSQREGGKRG